MFICIGKPESLDSLQTMALDFGNKRSQVPIAVIDDQGFDYEELLRKHDFNIKVFRDITDIRSVEAYPIVVCDIKGVGKSFGSQYEGAHIISEIRRYYPEKILIAYSAHQFDPSYNRYFQMCDSVLKKDMDSDQWVDNLDASIKKVVDPVQQWVRMRNYLLARDIELHTVLLLEHEYINAVKKKKRDLFAKNRTLGSLPADIKAVVINFSSSLLFKLLVG